MPAKKKRAPKKKAAMQIDSSVFDADVEPVAAVVADTFETALAFADFPCEASEAEARNLYATHGETFVAWCNDKAALCTGKPDPFPLSFLVKIARVECAGGFVKQRRRASFKDKK